MYRTLLTAIGGCLILLAASCQRKEDVTVAGKGGSSILQISPVHGGSEPVDSCVLYIKYNVQDAPANGKYDDSTICNLVDSEPLGVFPQLHRGNYYIYGTAYNPTHNDRVKGGLPFHIDQEGQLYKLKLNLGH